MPETLRLLLARHGETDWNREGRWQGVTDVPLNAAGEAQAIELAERLAALSPGRVVSSHLARARRTAEIVAERLALAPPELDPELRERRYGAFEGLTGEECSTRYPAEWAVWAAGRIADPPGSETRNVVGARVLAALTKLATRLAGETRPIVVVSHGGAIRSFLFVALGIEAKPIGNGGVWEVGWSEDRFVRAVPLGAVQVGSTSSTR